MFRAGTCLVRKATWRLTGMVALGAALTLVVIGVAVSESDSLAGASTRTPAASFPAESPSHSSSKYLTPSLAPSINIAGSSFAAVAIQEWVGQSALLYGLNINWQFTSSIVALNLFADHQVDVGASDIPYSSGQASAVPHFPYQYIPDVASGLSFMYNLTGRDGHRIANLVLNAQVIDKIFLGEITSWNSPSIAQINPQLAGDLPSTRIVPVYRTDPSGENYLLSDYLLHEDRAAFTAAQNAFHAGGILGVGKPSATWPTPTPGASPSRRTYPGWAAGNPVGENGSDNAANYVSAPSSRGSITYVETAYAKEHDMPVASLLNAARDAVQPNSLNVATALKDARLNSDLTQNLTKVYTDSAPDAYPLSSYGYLVTACSPTLASKQGTKCDGTGSSTFSKAEGSVLGKFITFMACAGQENISALGYAPLPKNLVQEDFNAIGRLPGGVQPPAPTAANCPNPTITAGLHAPGG